MSDITPAASVLLSRGPGSREILAILRSSSLKFFGGFWAFPGGKLSRHDVDLAESVTSSDTHVHARRIAACRELFEETGVLVARDAQGKFALTDADLARCRDSLLLEQLSFGQLLAERGLSVRKDDFQLIGEITTPAFATMRFATTFFTAHLPEGQEADVQPGELERGEWSEVEALLMRWRRGECQLTPPSVMSLQMLGAHPVEEAPALLGPLLDRLNQGAMHPIYFAPCVRMIPLKTMALSPGTHTNAFIVGSGPRYLIDPGPEEPAEQARLFSVIEEERQEGHDLAAIVLTHHHRDHVGAAAVCAERYGLPIWAHPATAERLHGRVKISRLLIEGDRIDLGSCPADSRRWFLDVLHTPGHAPGHLVFVDSHYGLLFAGDMVSTLSSMVIAPPDGNMAEYLQSLRRLRNVPCRMLLPAHGNVSLKAAQVIDDALEHRARRERQLLAPNGFSASND